MSEEKRNISVGIRLTKEEKERLDKLAEMYGISRTSLICMLINKEWRKAEK